MQAEKLVSQFAPVPTNAASSGVTIDKKVLKQLVKRSDHHGLKWLCGWLALLGVSGYGLHLSFNTPWLIPMLFLYGGILTLSGYALSHECAHGTAFRTRWLNEILFWISSFIYFQEHYYRRYTHASHHTYTYHKGLDAQLPYEAPLTFWLWLQEITYFSYIANDAMAFIRNALGRFATMTLDCTPESELPKLMWSARIYLAFYTAMGVAIFFGADYLLWYFVLPRILGGVVMAYFVLLQHVEMKENQMDVRESTRSFDTNFINRFLYMNMNYHVEHHLYPTVPFHALSKLSYELKDQLPNPDPGLFLTNWWALKTVIGRSMGKISMENLARRVPIR